MASIAIRVGTVGVGGGVVYGTARAEETSPLPPGRRRGWGRGRFWFARGLVIPGFPEERHDKSEEYGGPIAQDFILERIHGRQWN